MSKMSEIKTRARTAADLIGGRIIASVDIAAPPERTFRALASPEIVDWWVNPGVFDTREWAGEVNVGGRWRASGMARGEPYTLEGEFLEVDPPQGCLASNETIRRLKSIQSTGDLS